MNRLNLIKDKYIAREATPSLAVSLLSITTCILLLSSFFFPLNIHAQKKEIAQIQEFLKKRTSPENAQELADKLLTDSTYQKNPRIWQLLGESLFMQYDAANEKLYLRQQYDTAKFFSLTKRLFSVYETLDSLSLTDIKHNKTIEKTVERKVDDLHRLRQNLFNGGIYHIYKHQYNEAYQYFDTYIECSAQHLFKKYNYSHSDTLLPRAAYWAVYCGYKTQNPRQALHHSYMALKDTANTTSMLQYLAETYKLDNDTTRYIQSLVEGFQRSPSFPYFFPRLFQYYSQREQWEECQEITTMAIQADPSNPLFAFAQSNIYLNTGAYDQCIAISDSLIQANDTIARTYLNAGLSYYYKAVINEKKLKKTAQDKRTIIEYYRKARPYLETYRLREPERSDKWAMPLYIIYLNLNMGEDFDEIDRLLKIKQHAQEQHLK